MTPEEKETRKQKRKNDKWEKEHKIIDGIIYKWCNYGKHWEVMDDIHYYKNKCNNIDGFHPNCKTHVIEKSLNWQKQNPKKYKRMMHKYNTNPSIKTKQCWSENSIRINESGYRSQWRKNNKEKCREYQRERLKEKEHIITSKEWSDCRGYFNNACAYCGMTEIEHKKLYNQQLHKEHVIDCGRNDLKNCIPSCKNCNSEKHTTSLNDWYNEKNYNYTRERYLNIYQWIRYDCFKYILKKKPKRKYNKIRK